MTKPHFFLFPPPPSPSAVSSKGQPDILKVCYFASAGTYCIGGFVLEVPYEFFFLFFFSYLHWNHCKGAHIKLVILHLFIWTFPFHCSQCSLNVKLDFCQTEDSTLYLILLKHLVPEFHIEETWIPPTVKVWIGLCICMRYISSVNPLHT